MVKCGFHVELKSKLGKEAEVEAFLKQGPSLAKAEPGTIAWYASKYEDEPGRYGIVDTFADEAGRQAHAKGELAKALGARAGALFSEPPKVHPLLILGQK